MADYVKVVQATHECMVLMTAPKLEAWTVHFIKKSQLVKIIQAKRRSVRLLKSSSTN